MTVSKDVTRFDVWFIYLHLSIIPILEELAPTVS